MSMHGTTQTYSVDPTALALWHEEENLAEGVEAEEESDLASITVPFNPEQIKIHTISVVASQIVTRIQESEIDLAPDFQREYIWNHTRQSRLIESLLLRIPIPVFYVAADNEDNWKVVDGVQRISTINNYMKNEFVLRNLEYLNHLEGLFYKDLPRPMQRRISETQLIVNVIDPGTPEDVMSNVFGRINTGGVPLNAQEIRHALNPGIAREYLKELAQSRAFLRATGGSVKSRRMKDRECVLRFLAFYMEPWNHYDTRDLNGYLTSAMRKVNEASSKERSVFTTDFKKAMDASYRIFGDDAFRRRHTSDRRGPINMALLETWGTVLAKCTPGEIETLIKKRRYIQQESLRLMLEDSDFINAISYSTGSQYHVQKRFTTVEELVRSILQC